MNKIILLLAGSGMQEREISNALRDVESMSDKDLYRLIGDLRKYEGRPMQSE